MGLVGLLLSGVLWWLIPVSNDGPMSVVSVAGAREGPAMMAPPEPAARAPLPARAESQPQPLDVRAAPTASSPAGPEASSPIAVRVVDDRGLPVEGVGLSLISKLPARHLWSSGEATPGESDAAGLAVWTGYPGVAHAIRLKSAPEGFVQSSGRFARDDLELLVDASRDAPGEPLVFTLPRLGEIVVDLGTAGDLTALERLVVASQGGREQGRRWAWEPWQNDDRQHEELIWSVDPGTHLLRGYWSIESGIYSPDQRVVVHPGERRVVQLSKKAANGVLTGRVVDSLGMPLGGMSVQVDILREPSLVLTVRTTDHRSVRNTVSGADGTWRIDAVPPGRAYVKAKTAGYGNRYLASRDTMSVLVEARPESAPTGAEAPSVHAELQLEPGYEVVGRVVGPWSEAWRMGLLGLRVECTDSAAGRWAQRFSPRPRVGGSFLLEHCQAGTYKVTISSMASLKGRDGWKEAVAWFRLDASLEEGALVERTVAFGP